MTKISKAKLSELIIARTKEPLDKEIDDWDNKFNVTGENLAEKRKLLTFNKNLQSYSCVRIPDLNPGFCKTYQTIEQCDCQQE